MSYYGGGGGTVPQPLGTTDAPQFAGLGLGAAADANYPLKVHVPTNGGVLFDKPDESGTQYLYFGRTSTRSGAVGNRWTAGSGGSLEFHTYSSAGVSQLTMTLTHQRSVVIGNAALATNDYAGHFYLPSCPGTPTQAPTAATGRVPLVYDSTGNVLYAYNSGWKRVDGLPINTKGDLLVHTGSARARLPVGTDGQVLTADSGQTNGVKWSAPAAWSSSNLTVLTRNAMQSLLSWQEPYDASRTNVIEWDTENLDNLGVWDSGSPGLITIQATGWYRIDVHLPTVMNSWSRAAILKNSTNFGSGTDYLENVVHAIPNGSGSVPNVHLLHHPAVYLAANDVLRVTVIGTAGGNTGVDAEDCKLWIQRLA